MRLRPVSLLLAPLWLLVALALLSSCEHRAAGPSVVRPEAGGGTSTALVITLTPAPSSSPRGGMLLREAQVW